MRLLGTEELIWLDDWLIHAGVHSKEAPPLLTFRSKQNTSIPFPL